MSTVALEQGVPKINIGLNGAFENSGRVGEVRRESDAEGQKLGNQKGILLAALVDDVRVDLLQASDGLAPF